jgi:hypothetical protein
MPEQRRKQLIRTFQGLLALSLFLLTCMGAGFGAEPKKKEATRVFKPNPKLAELAENSWLKLNPKREALSRAYCGTAFGGGLLWYFGGAHRSYMGNDVDLYNPLKNQWRRSEIEWPEPEDVQLIASVRAPRQPLTPKGRPWTAHTYQQTCYVPERKSFFYIGRGHTWEFDPAKMQWTCLAGAASKSKKPSPRYQGSQCMHVIYDPVLKAPLGITTTQPFGVHLYDYKTMAWKRRKNAPMKWAELYSTYMASRKLHLISANKKHGMWTYDALKDEWKKLTNVPEKVIGTQALAYDSRQDTVFVATLNKKTGPVTLWKLDVKKMKWSEQKTANAGPRGRSLWAPMWYDADHGLFYYLNYEGRGPEFKGGKTGIWAYRYKKVN